MPGSSAKLFSIPELSIFKSQILGCKVAFPVSSSSTSLFFKAEIRLSQTFNFNTCLFIPFGILSFSNKLVFIVKPVVVSVYAYTGLIVIKIAANICATLT